MIRRAATAIATGAALIVFLGGCGRDLPPLRFETAHVRYHISPDRFVCDGFPAWLEHHYETLAAFLGVALPPGEKIDVYVETRADIEAECGAEVDGCTHGLEVFSIDTFYAHELVHAYAYLAGDPPLLFQEGLAEVIGCAPWAREQWIQALDLQPLLESRRFDALSHDDRFNAYGPAASFTRFLIDRYGRDRFMRFYRRTPFDALEPAIAAYFEEAFGTSIESALAAWASEPPRTGGDACLFLAECATPPLAPPDMEGALTCGPAVPPATGFLKFVRSVSVPEPTAATLSLRSSRPMVAEVRGCDGDLRPDLSHFYAGYLGLRGLGYSTDVWTTLPAGNLWVHGSQDVPEGGGTATDATVALHLLGAAENNPCAGPPVHGVEAGGVTVVWRESLASATSVDPATGDPRIGARFRLADARSLDVIPRFDVIYDGTTQIRLPYDGSVLTICREACPETNPGACTSAPLDAPVLPFPFGSAPLDPNVDYTLVVSGAPTWRGVFITLDFLP